jgi:UDP-glucose 4-epimerase
MNILVVGGAGYIGSHCLHLLIKEGHTPVVLDNLVFGHRNAIPAGVAFVEGNLGDESLVEATLKKHGIQAVMHFAAFAYVGESVENPLKYYFNNTVETLGLLRCMIKCGVKRFVFSSTCATYGIPDSMPITETTAQRPINPYGQTKYDIENALRWLSGAHGLSFASFRYFNAAGASEEADIGEDHKPETHLIPLAFQAAMGLRPPLQVFGDDYPTPDGTCLRDYVHVDDLSRAHIDVLPRLGEAGAGLFYNLGTGRPTSVREILAAIHSVSGLKVPFEISRRRAGDPPALFANAEKAHAELGWVPRYDTITKIIDSAWKWHKRHPNGYVD